MHIQVIRDHSKISYILVWCIWVIPEVKSHCNTLIRAVYRVNARGEIPSSFFHNDRGSRSPKVCHAVLSVHKGNLMYVILFLCMNSTQAKFTLRCSFSPKVMKIVHLIILGSMTRFSSGSMERVCSLISRVITTQGHLCSSVTVIMLP